MPGVDGDGAGQDGARPAELTHHHQASAVALVLGDVELEGGRIQTRPDTHVKQQSGALEQAQTGGGIHPAMPQMDMVSHLIVAIPQRPVRSVHRRCDLLPVSRGSFDVTGGIDQHNQQYVAVILWVHLHELVESGNHLVEPREVVRPRAGGQDGTPMSQLLPALPFDRNRGVLQLLHQNLVVDGKMAHTDTHLPPTVLHADDSAGVELVLLGQHNLAGYEKVPRVLPELEPQQICAEKGPQQVLAHREGPQDVRGREGRVQEEPHIGGPHLTHNLGDGEDEVEVVDPDQVGLRHAPDHRVAVGPVDLCEIQPLLPVPVAGLLGKQGGVVEQGPEELAAEGEVGGHVALVHEDGDAVVLKADLPTLLLLTMVFRVNAGPPHPSNMHWQMLLQLVQHGEADGARGLHLIRLPPLDDLNWQRQRYDQYSVVGSDLHELLILPQQRDFVLQVQLLINRPIERIVHPCQVKIVLLVLVGHS
mmetsp:Transcript_15744/g.40011  ORF Transcript_15744/g.40011 Transcript_15744/m.40011 type:complete len:476 (-) Transcript_15744:351-1778(-)